MDLNPLLRRVVRDLEPTPAEKNAARRSHAFLRDRLRTGDIGGRILDDYLSGSYRRNTAISPLGDVDVIFAIDPSQWPGAFFGFSSKPLPSTVLQTFASALRYRYKRTSAFSQRRSIRLELDHLHIDCVPAIPIEGTDFILVGDRKKDEWVKSSPKRHEQALSSVNKANGNCVVPLVKLLKCWNRGLPSTARLRSFVIETMAVTVFQHVAFETLEEGILLFLDFVSKFAGDAKYEWNSNYDISMNFLNDMVVPDSAGTGNNVASGVSYGQMKKFQQQAIFSRNKLLLAKSSTSEALAGQRVLSAMKLA